MKINTPLIAGICFVVSCTSYASAFVGRVVPIKEGETYGPMLVVSMLLMTGVPFLLGIAAGRHER